MVLHGPAVPGIFCAPLVVLSVLFIPGNVWGSAVVYVSGLKDDSFYLYYSAAPNRKVSLCLAIPPVGMLCVMSHNVL